MLTGCSVRADNAHLLARRYPAVDLFLRPDEEPELAARLGLSGPTSPGLLARAQPGYAWAARGTAATADRLTASRAPRWRTARVARGSATHAWLPIIYGCDKTCTYCIVPFSRGPERSRPFDDIVARGAARSRPPATRTSRSWARTSTRTATTCAPDPRFADVRATRAPGPRPALRRPPGHRRAAARHRRHGRTPDGAPAIPRLRFITSHPWDLGERLIAAMAESPSVCEHLHLPVQSGDDAVLRRMGRQYTADAYLGLVERLRAAIPGIA